MRRCASAAKKTTTTTEMVLGKPTVIAVVEPLPTHPPPLPFPIIHSTLFPQPIEPEIYCELDGTVDPLLKLTLDECLELLAPMEGMGRNTM